MKNDNYLQESQGNIYDSYEMQDPRGKVLFLCDKKKVNWYIKKDLVTHIEAHTYRLKFEPKGPGNTNPFFLEKLPNHCVVCGAKEHLSKHHIVPYQYRKVLPDDYKNSNHFDILCVCLDCHETYEDEANKLKDSLHKKYDIPLQGIENQNKTIIAINGILYTLKEKFKDLSQSAIDGLLKNLGKHVGYNITLEEAVVMEYHDIPSDTYFDTRDTIFMERYLEKGNNIEEFILMWRNHFLDTMKPKHISQNWLDHYKTFFKKTN
jgi:hypothetical protein